MGQEDRSLAAQGSHISPPPPKPASPPFPRNGAGKGVFRALETEGKGTRQRPALRVLGPCGRTAGPEGCVVPLHLGSESVPHLPTQGAAAHHGEARLQPAGWSCLPALSEAPVRGTCLQSAHLSFLGLSEDIDGLEVVGRGQPFSTVTVKDFLVFEKSQRSSSGDIRNA